MKLTCSQIDILVSFYLENELSPCLKQRFEEHLRECESCSQKVKIIEELFSEMKNITSVNKYVSNVENIYSTMTHGDDFGGKLSAYIDNELSGDENIRIKKIAITNKKARKELEDSYNIRRLMSESYRKSRADAKQDYTKAIMKRLELEDEIQSGFHPAVRLLIIFTVSVILITTLVLFSLNL